jgi:hypothetical protein
MTAKSLLFLQPGRKLFNVVDAMTHAFVVSTQQVTCIYIQLITTAANCKFVVWPPLTECENETQLGLIVRKTSIEA